MDIRTTYSEDPAFVLRVAAEFLASKPVEHNMVLSLLHARTANPEPGRYWVAAEGGRTAGVALQSPLTYAAVLTPMEARVVEAMADTIAACGVKLPGINGDAATAAAFAGQWTERTKSSATPFQGMRLYELAELREIPQAPGLLRQAVRADRRLLSDWVGAFQEEIREPIVAPEQMVERWLASGSMWIWDSGEPVSMAVSRDPAERVVRISGVYTPRHQRGRGFASSCVHALSRQCLDTGYRCMLYTDLANPSSNSIYRQIGYRAVAEALRYRFE